MSLEIYGVIAGLLLFVALAGVSVVKWQAHKIKQQQQQIAQIQAEAKIIAEELENAQTAKKHQQKVRNATTSDIDRQLHDKNYFRD